MQAFFFAVFHYHSPTWDWNALPQAYLSSPRLSLDTQALNQYFNQENNQFYATQSENNVQEMGDAAPKCKVTAIILRAYMELHITYMISLTTGEGIEC